MCSRFGENLETCLMKKAFLSFRGLVFFSFIMSTSVDKQVYKLFYSSLDTIRRDI
jgi:hypothetical protein